MGWLGPAAELSGGTRHGLLGPGRGLLRGVRDTVSIPFEDAINVLDLSHGQMHRFIFM